MKLWLLRPQANLSSTDNPWNPWYDKSFGFVIRAETEEKARELAHDNAGDENRGEFFNQRISATKSPWKDSNYSTCVELSAVGAEELIMQDFAAA